MSTWIYRCGECGSSKRVDHSSTQRRTRPIDEDPAFSRLLGSRDRPQNEIPFCCDRPMHGRVLRAEAGAGRYKCSQKCVEAVGAHCRCPCLGKNHGTAYG